MAHKFDTRFDGNKAEILKLELNKDKDGYFLSAKIRVEDKVSIKEFDIPKIIFPVNEERMSLTMDANYYSGEQDAFIDFGFGICLKLSPTRVNRHEVLFTERLIEEKFAEMSIEEIEKKLGYKIKIVNK